MSASVWVYMSAAGESFMSIDSDPVNYPPAPIGAARSACSGGDPFFLDKINSMTTRSPRSGGVQAGA